jgi:hypothetical protein
MTTNRRPLLEGLAIAALGLAVGIAVLLVFASAIKGSRMLLGQMPFDCLGGTEPVHAGPSAVEAERANEAGHDRQPGLKTAHDLDGLQLVPDWDRLAPGVLVEHLL